MLKKNILSISKPQRKKQNDRKKYIHFQPGDKSTLENNNRFFKYHNCSIYDQKLINDYKNHFSLSHKSIIKRKRRF